MQGPSSNNNNNIPFLFRELQSLYNTMDSKVQTIGKVLLTRAETKRDGVITLLLIGSFLEEIIEGSYRPVQTQGNILLVSSITVPSKFRRLRNLTKFCIKINISHKDHYLIQPVDHFLKLHYYCCQEPMGSSRV